MSKLTVYFSRISEKGHVALKHVRSICFIPFVTVRCLTQRRGIRGIFSTYYRAYPEFCQWVQIKVYHVHPFCPLSLFPLRLLSVLSSGMGD